MSILRSIMIDTPAKALSSVDSTLDTFHAQFSREIDSKFLKISIQARSGTSYIHKVFVLLGWISLSAFARNRVSQMESTAKFQRFCKIVNRALVWFLTGRKADGSTFDDNMNHLVLRQLGVLVCTMRTVYAML
jgi:hypothetical protein